jgi:hypothetical protein
VGGDAGGPGEAYERCRGGVPAAVEALQPEWPSAALRGARVRRGGAGARGKLSGAAREETGWGGAVALGPGAGVLTGEGGGGQHREQRGAVGGGLEDQGNTDSSEDAAELGDEGGETSGEVETDEAGEAGDRGGGRSE